MADRVTAERKLSELRELIVNARAMPMSASCVINRSEVLEAIDDAMAGLPDEIAEARALVDMTDAKVAEGEAKAARIVERAKDRASELARESEIIRVAEEEAARILADAAAEAAELRREVDVFIDARMASFESVLHKTASQVKTARLRLAERSGLDSEHDVRHAGHS